MSIRLRCAMSRMVGGVFRNLSCETVQSLYPASDDLNVVVHRAPW
jgi:hypothetical protein